MDSALWNLMLYTLPTSVEVMASGKVEIPYRYCPHLDPDNPRGFIFFCMRHIAIMCGRCANCHDHRCREGK
jgi:hypothetical protein